MTEDRTTGPEFRLPPTDPGGWTDYEIVYTRFTRDAAGKIITDPGSSVVCHTKLDDFLKKLGKPQGVAPACYQRKRHDNDPRKGGPLDIYVGCASYVVIELDPKLGWQFAKGRAGVTTKKDYGDTNWGLQHVMPNGLEFGDEGPNADDCRIVYFRVADRDEFERQHFRLHVVSGDQRKDPVEIDPDIPNDGGKFPMFPRTPCMNSQEGAPDCRKQ